MVKKISRYLEIANDIAARIVRNDLVEGQKISGRSVLSSEYGVSPETVRRALKLLMDKNVVEVINNSGVKVGNKANALLYLESSDSQNDILQLKNQLAELMIKRNQLDLQINIIIDRIVDLAGKFSSSDPMKRFEFTLGENSPLAFRTLKESSFYQLTRMTLVGIQHGETMILSPGPDAIIKPGDRLSVVGRIQDIDVAEKIINV